MGLGLSFLTSAAATVHDVVAHSSLRISAHVTSQTHAVIYTSGQPRYPIPPITAYFLLQTRYLVTYLGTYLTENSRLCGARWNHLLNPELNPGFQNPIHPVSSCILHLVIQFYTFHMHNLLITRFVNFARHDNIDWSVLQLSEI